ncbi:MAG: B12-binding domain-containing radical SAM protein, partial [Treponema sp.]|nr:B12-binding domain-containing radical SAM protein [Treponema sp.]
MKTVNPLEIFGSELCSVQNPSSYIGGEFGSIVKKHTDGDDMFNFGIAFPDVYDIGMSNQAIKIIYNGLNKIGSVRCERIFAVDKDFEELLKKHDVPQYTLETGMPLNELDMIGFSIGYELGITGVLSILDLGRIPLLKKDRGENDPIVIAGGCGATNPAPFSDFFDAVFIGEAEGGMFDLIEELSVMKKSGKSRKDILEALSKNRHVWTEDMSVEKCGHAKAFRAVWSEFGTVPSVQSFMPLPNTKPVQDHGV